MEKHIYFLTIVLVILVCFFIFRYLSNDYLEYKKLNPYLIEHTKQISNGDNTIPNYIIRKSIDQHHGMEFTYAFWLNIDAVVDEGRYNILKKGSDACPGIYVTKDSDSTMALHVDINIWPNKINCDKYTDEEKCKDNLCNWDNGTCKNYKCSVLTPGVNCPKTDVDKPCCSDLDFCQDNETSCVQKDKKTCIVNNLPINKWTHIIVMLVGNYLDIFINGNLYERFEIKGVPHQNDGDLIIGDSPSATGSIMRLQYFNYAIPASKINKIISKTEITKDVKTPYEDESTTDYLDKNYWTGQNVNSNKRMY